MESSIPQEVKSPQKCFKSLHRSRLLGHGEKFMQENIFWKELCPMGSPSWSSLFLRDWTSWKGLMLKQFLEHHSLWKGPILEQFMKDCLLWEGPHWSKGTEESWIISGIWKEGWWDGGFNFRCFSHFPTLVLTDNKWIFPKLSFACEGSWWSP